MKRRWPAVGIGLGLLVVIQLVPYGRTHDNPPVHAEPAWDTPRTRELAVRACFDCHSNQTVWPWYSNVAPLSWIVQHDVMEGRRHVNYSEWDRPQPDARDSAEEMRHGVMPPSYYVILHRSAQLPEPDWQALVAGLTATFGSGRGGEPRP